MSTAITMYIAVLFLVSWVPAHWKRRIVGYGFLSDITVHFVLQTLFGGDANGRAGLLLAGVLINLTMHGYRRFFGYEKLVLGQGWMRYAGQLTRPADMPPPARAKRKPTKRRSAKA